MVSFPSPDISVLNAESITAVVALEIILLAETFYDVYKGPLNQKLMDSIYSIKALTSEYYDVLMDN